MQMPSSVPAFSLKGKVSVLAATGGGGGAKDDGGAVVRAGVDEGLAGESGVVGPELDRGTERGGG